MTSTNEGLTLCPCPAGRCDPESTTLNAQGSQLCDQEVDDGFLHLTVSVRTSRLAGPLLGHDARRDQVPLHPAHPWRRGRQRQPIQAGALARVEAESRPLGLLFSVPQVRGPPPPKPQMEPELAASKVDP